MGGWGGGICEINFSGSAYISLSCLVAACCRFFSSFDLSDVLLLCLVNPVLDGDHLVGEVGNDCFAFVCFLDCLLFVFVCSSSW